MERRNAWKQYDEAEIKALEPFCIRNERIFSRLLFLRGLFLRG